jgi:hypothetical protein
MLVNLCQLTPCKRLEVAEMNRLWVSVAVAFLGCVGCGPTDSSAQQAQASSGETSRGSAPDRPIHNAFQTASEVRLFVNTDYDQNGEPIFSKPDGLLLTGNQRAEFESFLSVHTVSPDELFAMCFIPHHFFRYFDKTGKLVGEVAVCFCCAGVEQTGASNIKFTKDEMLSADYGKLKSFVSSLGERTDVQCQGQT